MGWVGSQQWYGGPEEANFSGKPSSFNEFRAVTGTRQSRQDRTNEQGVDAATMKDFQGTTARHHLPAVSD